MDKSKLATLSSILEKSGLAQLFAHHCPDHTLHKLVTDTLDEPSNVIEETIQIIHVLLHLNNGMLNSTPEEFHNLPPLLCNRIHVDIIKFLVDQGAELITHLSSDVSESVLHRASEYLNPDQYHELVTHLVIKEHVDVLRSRSRTSATPLHKALRNMELRKETVSLFINSGGVTLNEEDDMGCSVLVYAIRRGAGYDYLSMLVKLGADWKKLDGSGNTVVHSATDYGNYEAVRYFVTLGVDPNSKNRDGCTPLHVALRWGIRNTHEIVGVLVEMGADVSVVDNEGHSPLWYTTNGWKRIEDRTRELLLAKIQELDGRTST